WPNDVEVAGRKLAGILVETAGRGGVIYREIAEALEVALRQFGPRERRVVRQLIDGESYGAIAAREGISLNALKVRIHRLRLVLRVSVRAAQDGVVSTDGLAAGRVAA
ncbi:MAG: hypothetical protein ACKODK_10115, partial [Opitutaceae bacterium]